MKAVISTTPDNMYLFYVPLTIWAWNKLGVPVIWFADGSTTANFNTAAEQLVFRTIRYQRLRHEMVPYYCSPDKSATYAQCSRLYAAALDLPEDELLVTSDIDMLVFKMPPLDRTFDSFAIWGADLVPPKQYPMCYITATVKMWRMAFEINGRTTQECLDGLLAHEECENMRGNLWCRDQETAYNVISAAHPTVYYRARPGTQFASNRIDRDDSFWRDRLSPDIIDAHLWRPGYEENNFNNILELLHYFYPAENFQWLIDYRN